MIHAEFLCQQFVLRGNHVVIRVMRKLRMQTITWFARTAMSDAVRQDDEITRRVQELSRPKQNVRKLRRKKLRARAAGAVSNQHRVAHDA